MTITKRYLAEFKDLKALNLTCHSCNATISIPFSEKPEHIPLVCPYCTESVWFQRTGNDIGELYKLLDAIKSIKNLADKPCIMRLELTTPD